MLDEYRREYSEFNHRWMHEHYLFLSGQKPRLDIAPIYDRFSDLFSRDSIARLQEAIAEVREHFSERHTALRRLLTFAIDHHLANSVTELTELISAHEASATVEQTGRRLTFQESTAAIGLESDRAKRSELFNLRGKVIESSNELRAERLSALHATARGLSYSGYRDLYEQLHGFSYDELATGARHLLARTESLYLSRLEEALRRFLGIGLAEAIRPDALYFLHLTAFDDRFPGDRLIPVYIETMAGLGIRVESQHNILIDGEKRSRKSPRAFCAPVSVPDEIKLVIRPSGGQSDYLALLHEAGHAQHYGWTSSELSPEFKYTGDPALSETFAFLFNHLPGEPAWLSEFLGFDDSREFIRSLNLTRLVTVRRYAAKFLYECELHSGERTPDAPGIYAELQTAATKFRTPEVEYLFDLDDAFYSAGYLRAWAFEVILSEYLRTRYGQQWWTVERAGRFLKEMWETGDRYSADELARQIGIGPLSFEPLIDDFNRSLA